MEPTLADVFEYTKNDQYTHGVAFLNQNIDDDVEPEVPNMFRGKTLYKEQHILAHWCWNSHNILFSGPSSCGKSFLALWSADVAIQHNLSFAFVVSDDVRKQLLHNEFKRYYPQKVCIDDREEHINSDEGLIITIQSLRKYTDSKVIKQTQLYIFDDMDQLLDKEQGHLWDEVLTKLPPKSRYKRPFKFNFQISVPQDLNNMTLFEMSRDLEEFSINESNFTEAMQTFYSPKTIASVVDFVDKCVTTFPIRLTVQKLFKDRAQPTMVIVFSDRQSIINAWQLSDAMQLLKVHSRLNVTRALKEFNDLFEEESEEYTLFTKLLPMFLNGTAYLNRSMPQKLRELVEALFHQNLIRILVVTEEVAINSFFRTKNLVVSLCRKYDGDVHRYLTNYEWQRLLCLAPPPRYSKTTITLIVDWKMKRETLEQIVLPQPLKIQALMFNPTEQTVPPSFYRFMKLIERESAGPELASLKTQLRELEDEPKINVHIRDAFKLENEIGKLREEIDRKSFTYQNTARYLSCGRLVKVVVDNKDFGVGIVLKFDEPDLYVALRMTRDSRKNIHDYRLLTPANKDELVVQEGDTYSVAPIEIVKITPECVKLVYALRVCLPQSLREKKEFNFLYVLFNGLGKYKLNRVEIDDPELSALCKKLKDMEEELKQKPVRHRDDYNEILEQYNYIEDLREKAEKLEKVINEYGKMPFTIPG